MASISNSRLYNARMVVSGNIVEHYRYQYPVRKGQKRYPHSNKNLVLSDTEPVDKDKKYAENLHRARVTLRRLINSNCHRYYDIDGAPIKPKFLTLTFAENRQDVQECNYEFKKFVKRLTYRLTSSKESFLKYATVIELQKRGAIHYHSVFFNLPYVKKSLLAEVWGHGFVKVNAIDNVTNVGAYVSKYMAKEMDCNEYGDAQGPHEVQSKLKTSTELLRGQKRYFTSRGLYKPFELQGQAIDSLLPKLGAPVYSTAFETDFLGKVEYSQYLLESAAEDIKAV